MSQLPGDCAAFPALVQLYRDEITRCQATIDRVTDDPTEGPVSPHLICPPAGYSSADFRLMVVGQETNGWEQPFHRCAGVEHLLAVYDKFINPDGGRYRSPFLDAVRNYLRRFRSVIPNTSLVWTNILKIGCSRSGAPSPAVIDWMAGRSEEGTGWNGWFSVVNEEVKQLKPDAVIFFTGPGYDEFIPRAFPDVKFEDSPLPGVFLNRVDSIDLPPCSFRTWHPNWFRWRAPRGSFAAVQDLVLRMEVSLSSGGACV